MKGGCPSLFLIGFGKETGDGMKMIRVPLDSWNVKKQHTKLNTFAQRDNIIREQVQKDKGVIYGAQAMNANLKWKILARPTRDYDILTKNPAFSARMLEKSLDSAWGGDYYYTKPAKYKNTVKVMSRGLKLDDPNDDYTVADFTRPTRKVSTIEKQGIPYARLEEREADARRTLSKPGFEFRAEKDFGDLNRIKIDRRLR